MLARTTADRGAHSVGLYSQILKRMSVNIKMTPFLFVKTSSNFRPTGHLRFLNCYSISGTIRVNEVRTIKLQYSRVYWFNDKLRFIGKTKFLQH